jgi:hypothetical protein
MTGDLVPLGYGYISDDPDVTKPKGFDSGTFKFNFIPLMPMQWTDPIERVIYNGPATIVFWDGGTKTVVKCHDEEFDPEKGLAMAIAKKALGSDYHKTFKRWCSDAE